eukprot:jgi/Bigna1/86544/estExt_fgenesh1_pg.C_110166
MAAVTLRLLASSSTAIPRRRAILRHVRRLVSSSCASSHRPAPPLLGRVCLVPPSPAMNRGWIRMASTDQEAKSNPTKEERCETEEEKKESNEDTSGESSNSSSTGGGGQGEDTDSPPAWHTAITCVIYFGLGWVLHGVVSFITDIPPGAYLAKEIAEKSPRIIEEVGTPLSLSYMWSGNSSENQLVANFPVKGPKGKATLVVRAVRVEEGWKMLILDAVLNDQWLEPVAILNEFEGGGAVEGGKGQS